MVASFILSRRIGDGFIDFSPTPEDNRLLFSASYAVDNTLVIQYVDDAIDQSPTLVEALMTRRGPAFTVEQRVLPGTHVTPLSPFASITPNRDFDPFIALSQAALAVAQKDLTFTAREVISWLEGTGSS